VPPYCFAHMRQRGLLPEGRLCREEGCCKLKVGVVSGVAQYCHRHTKAHGLEPVCTQSEGSGVAMSGCSVTVG
jgi:hypothetical protein